ncbi:MAG: helix-hairpin-helix domain-containing protein [Lactobacillaceae bacterium]|jgi:competence protein ComEA|nr:helix-hairpin-helix domain-containing protein [Lactobacillaceae bacterium]
MLDLLLTRYKKYLLAGIASVVVLAGGLIWWQTQTTATPQAELAEPVAPEQLASKATTSQVSSVATLIVVDVKGGVHKPGVYRFTQAPVVSEVLRKAGGHLADVDLKRINLAAKLVDGQVLYIPQGDETVPDEFALPGTATPAAGGVPGSAPVGGAAGATALVAVNTATTTELQTLPGIGEKRAADIIAQRDQMGGFKTVEDLREVSGIGEKTLEKLRPYLQVP